MIYGVGIAGFISGFILGLMILHFFLRHKSQKDLLEDKTLKLQFGLLNWGLAVGGAYVFIRIYSYYF